MNRTRGSVALPVSQVINPEDWMKSFFFRWSRMAVLPLVLLGASSASQANVECVVNPSKYFIGADGLLYIMWTQGGAGRAFSTSAGYRGILATVLTAMNSNRRLIIRLAAGSNCAVENDLVGVWLET